MKKLDSVEDILEWAAGTEYATGKYAEESVRKDAAHLARAVRVLQLVEVGEPHSKDISNWCRVVLQIAAAEGS